MKLKKFTFICLAVGLIFVLLGFLTPLFLVGENNTDYMWAFGNSFDGALSVLGVVGITLTITALFCLAFNKTVARHCTVKTSLVSLALSHAGVLGIICFFIWMSMAAFGEASQHPIGYPFSVCVGMLSLFAFLALLVLYLYFRRKTPSVIGFVIDVVTAVFYMPAALTVLSYTMLIAENILK